jgi:predicted esterase
MGSSCKRRPGAKAKIHFLGLLLLTFSRTVVAAPLDLPPDDAGGGAVLYPATLPGARPITVVLHGMCGHAENVCRIFQREATAGEHLVCPRASEPCPGGGSSWASRGFEPAIEHAVERATTILGERVDAARGRTLVGYSLGAFRALELAQHGGGRYWRLMLIAGRVQPNLKLLRASGVERLLLGAGAWDSTYEHLKRQRASLERAGIRSEFLSLGAAGHAFAPSFAQYLSLGWEWLYGDRDAL